MKVLDRKKRYYLGDLNDTQLRQVLDWLKVNYEGWKGVYLDNFKFGLDSVYLFYNKSSWHWDCQSSDLTNAKELFEDEKDNNLHDKIRELTELSQSLGLKIKIIFE